MTGYRHSRDKGIWDTIRLVAIIASVVVLVVAGALLFPGSGKFLEGIFGPGELPDIEFQTLQPDPGANGYLVCPLTICRNVEPDAVPPEYDIPVEALRNRILSLIDIQPNIEIHSINMARQKFNFVAKAPDMRFPDLITIQLYARGEGRSTLAIYSRSPLGGGTAGRNRERIETWLRLIEPLE